MEFTNYFVCVCVFVYIYMYIYKYIYLYIYNFCVFATRSSKNYLVFMCILLPIIL